MRLWKPSVRTPATYIWTAPPERGAAGSATATLPQELSIPSQENLRLRETSLSASCSLKASSVCRRECSPCVTLQTTMTRRLSLTGQCGTWWSLKSTLQEAVTESLLTRQRARFTTCFNISDPLRTRTASLKNWSPGYSLNGQSPTNLCRISISPQICFMQG